MIHNLSNHNSRYKLATFMLLAFQSTINTMDRNTELNALYPTLNNVLANIKNAYKKQLEDFKAATAPKVTPIVPAIQDEIMTLKNATAQLIDFMSSYQLKDSATGIRAVALGIINSMQVIDGNLQTYFDLFPEGAAYKEIIDDTLIKLRDLEQKANSIAVEMNKMRRSRGQPFPINEVKALEDCAKIILNIADTVRSSTLNILKLVQKKPKNIFKRIFGK